MLVPTSNVRVSPATMQGGCPSTDTVAASSLPRFFQGVLTGQRDAHFSHDSVGARQRISDQAISIALSHEGVPLLKARIQPKRPEATSRVKPPARSTEVLVASRGRSRGTSSNLRESACHNPPGKRPQFACGKRVRILLGLATPRGRKDEEAHRRTQRVGAPAKKRSPRSPCAAGTGIRRKWRIVSWQRSTPCRSSP
jgi:hypothetical protein